MNEQKSLLIYLGEALDRYRAARRRPAQEQASSKRPGRLRAWLPSRGNVLFTLLVVAGLLWASSVGALPLRAPAVASTSTGTIAYQGRLADADGNPITNTVNMIFRLYDVASGGVFLWEEQWTGSNGVQVSDGLFNVMLGSLTTIPQSVITGHDSLFLGITVGTDDEMTPRVQLGSVPFAVQALTVPDGSVTTEKIADGAVTQLKLGADVSLVPPDGSITTAKLADGAVTTAKINMDADLNMHGYEVRNVSQLWTNGRIEVGLDGQGEGGELRLATGTSGSYWVIDNYYGTLRAFHDEAVYFTVDPSGNLWAAGTKSAVVRAGEFGQRKLYAAESSEVRFFDEGLAHLKDGVARVTLDPVFLETIEGDYLVHVTPYGDASLYVAEIGKDYFVVRAREGDPNVTFAWRLSAHRKGYAGVRLERVEEARLR